MIVFSNMNKTAYGLILYRIRFIKRLIKEKNIKEFIISAVSKISGRRDPLDLFQPFFKADWKLVKKLSE